MAATDFRRGDTQLTITAPTNDVVFVVQMPRLWLGILLLHNESYIHGVTRLKNENWL
jgi:hypothetical protein